MQLMSANAALNIKLVQLYQELEQFKRGPLTPEHSDSLGWPSQDVLSKELNQHRYSMKKSGSGLRMEHAIKCKIIEVTSPHNDLFAYWVSTYEAAPLKMKLNATSELIIEHILSWSDTCLVDKLAATPTSKILNDLTQSLFSLKLKVRLEFNCRSSITSENNLILIVYSSLIFLIKLHLFAKQVV